MSLRCSTTWSLCRMLNWEGIYWLRGRSEWEYNCQWTKSLTYLLPSPFQKISFPYKSQSGTWPCAILCRATIFTQVPTFFSWCCRFQPLFFQKYCFKTFYLLYYHTLRSLPASQANCILRIFSRSYRNFFLKHLSSIISLKLPRSREVNNGSCLD